MARSTAKRLGEETDGDEVLKKKTEFKVDLLLFVLLVMQYPWTLRFAGTHTKVDDKNP